MKKIVSTLKTYHIAFLIAALIASIGVILVFTLVGKKINTKIFENNYYTFSYDTKWGITNKSDSMVKMKNDDKATLDIEIVQMSDDYKYSNINDFIDDLLYNINNQNREYKLISQKDSKVTKSYYDGYKFLYESDTSQVMITIAKTGDKVIIFNYEAKNKYFDILLDSVQNIIYNSILKPDTFDLSYKIYAETNDISYSTNDTLVDKIKSLKTYEIANSNYYVNYSIPDIFRMTSFDSQSGNFDYKEENNSITFNTYILNYNIYDYIDKSKEYSSIYSNYSYVKKDLSKYPNFVDGTSEFNIGKYKGYIYKVSYSTTEYIKKDIDAYIIAIALNKNHILIINIEGTNIKIPKELIDSIKINSVRNYSSYITRNIENNNLLVELKRFTNHNYNEYEILKIKLPEKYREIDKMNNIYSNRYFGLNYDSENKVYQYNVHYKFTTLTKKSEIDLANSNISSYKNYGEIKEMTFVEDRNINGKTFSIYNSSYYKKDRLYNGSDESIIYKIYERMLIYELDSGSSIVIIIDGNNIDVDEAILSELTNFEISKEGYK